MHAGIPRKIVLRLKFGLGPQAVASPLPRAPKISLVLQTDPRSFIDIEGTS
jgi:hypothetical protein